MTTQFHVEMTIKMEVIIFVTRHAVVYSTSGHPLAALLHNYRSRARDCVSVARQKLTSESVAQPRTGQAPAAASTLNMSSLQHSLPSGVNSKDFCRSIEVTEQLTFAAGGKNIAVDSETDGWKMDSVNSSLVSTSSSSLDQHHERPSQYNFTTESMHESRVPRDMASEITALLDQLEARMLSSYEELKSVSVFEDNLRIILEGFFFTQLWTEDILTFYRCASLNKVF